MKELKRRWTAKTPKFWKKVRNIAITLGAVAGVILTAPISLPATVITAAGYLATVGTVAATLSHVEGFYLLDADEMLIPVLGEPIEIEINEE